MNGQTTNLNKFNTPTIDQKGLIGFRGTVNLGANTPVVTAAPAPDSELAPAGRLSIAK